jgi:hypothetical protein
MLSVRLSAVHAESDNNGEIPKNILKRFNMQVWWHIFWLLRLEEILAPPPLQILIYLSQMSSFLYGKLKQYRKAVRTSASW